MPSDAEAEAMIEVILPDGAKRQLVSGSTGTALATDISKSLAKKAIAIKQNGKRVDLALELTDGAAVEVITIDSPEALELLRHDCAHVLAEAVQELFPGTQVTIGPAIENGFYYDFAREQPFTPDDLEIIQKRMREIIDRNE
ncbi:MAG: TGS domain-containing protein, partial [Rhodospirillales bacterium]